MLASGTATLESSTAIAGPATERSSRTANGFETLGESENRRPSCICTRSANRWLVSRYGRCASSQGMSDLGVELLDALAEPVAKAVALGYSYEYVCAVPIFPVDATCTLIK